MSLDDRQADPLRAEEHSGQQTPAYGYVVLHPDGTRFYLTSYDKALTVNNLPADWDADEAQVFTPAQVKHAAVPHTERFQPRSINISLSARDARIQRYLLTAAATRIFVWVIRFNAAGVLTGDPIDFATNGIIIEFGLLGQFAFSGAVVQCELTPEVYLNTGTVPRYFAQRRCNHVLYGPGCGLDKNDFKFESTIKTLDTVQRVMVLNGQKGGGAALDYFSGGHFLHAGLGMLFNIAWSEFSAGDTKFKLGNWHPDFAVDDSVTAYGGCRHTVADCTRLGNVANFGGMPYVPRKNPVANGT